MLTLGFRNYSESAFCRPRSNSLNILGVYKLIQTLIYLYRVNDFNLTNTLLNNKMSDERLQQTYITSYSWETPQRKFKSFGLLQGQVSFDQRVGLKTGNKLGVVTGKLGGLLCPF